MAKRLSDLEIKKRLQQLRNVTHLHTVARARLEKALATIKDLKLQLQARDTRIAEMEVLLADKESQRKELAAKLWKARKHRKQDQAAAEVSSEASTSSTASANKPKRKPGAQPGHTPHYRPKPLPSEVTDRQIFDLAVCPNCHNEVGDQADTEERYQEDIDLAPKAKIVRHYTITRHWCSNCREYVRPINTPAQHLRRFGPNLMGFILYARYRLRLPLLKIQESLKEMHNFEISEGEIQNQLDDARKALGDQYELICELIKTAHVVYADETGWRMDGDNWYLWAFVSPKDGAIRYELRDTRGGAVAHEALGGKADQIIVSDGYTPYNSMDSPNQQCWVHLDRVAKAKSPYFYGLLCKLYDQLLVELKKPIEQRDIKYFDDQLTRLQTMKPRKDDPLGHIVQARIARNHDQLLICLHYDDVLPENNTAERAIRPQTVFRKIFGCSRSPEGAKTHAVNTSVIATKLAQNPGQTFFEVMLPLVNEIHTKPEPKSKPLPDPVPT
jgi:transposase